MPNAAGSGGPKAMNAMAPGAGAGARPPPMGGASHDIFSSIARNVGTGPQPTYAPTPAARPAQPMASSTASATAGSSGGDAFASLTDSFGISGSAKSQPMGAMGNALFPFFPLPLTHEFTLLDL